MSRWSTISREIYFIFSSISIGAIAFVYFCDIRFLDIYNVGWLYLGANSDKAQAYLGWEFFRNSPWGIPLGENSSFGLLQDNSIAYSDSIPLLAIVTKALSGLTESKIQYFGIWLILCFILQSFFTTLIVKRFTGSPLLINMSSFLVVTLPFFLQRTPIHLALSGQFVIIASLYLFLKSTEHKVTKGAWLTLNTCTLLIHPYLFFMVISIYFAYLLNMVISGKRGWSNVIFEASISVTILLGITRFILGIPITSQTGASKTPYGTHPWNLLSLFNPRDWPKFLDFYPARDSGFDTFSYPGIGVLLLIAISFCSLLKNRKWVLNRVILIYPLALAVFSLLVFAITNRVGIGDLRIIIFENDALENRLSVFRSSARFAWPFLYLLIIFSFYFLFRFAPRRMIVPFILVCVAIQFADVRNAPGFLFPQRSTTYSAAGPSVDTFWQGVSGKYKKILVLQNPQDEVTGWSEIAIIANKLGMSTNAAYLARYNEVERNDLNSQIRYQLISGNYDSNSIYVIYGNPGFKVYPVGLEDRKILLNDKTIILPNWSPTAKGN